MKKAIFLLVLVLIAMSYKVRGQENPPSSGNSGLVTLGFRSSISMFNDGNWNSVGTGAGGQFRIRLSEQINTEWFYDYLTANADYFTHRTDEHIGWRGIVSIIQGLRII
jgi:hypothetical protein